MVAGEEFAPDFRAIFESAPGAYLILDTDFIIAAANDAYLQMTMTEREAIVGCSVFDVFADNPGNPEANGNDRMRASLQRVCELRRADAMPILKHDIRRPACDGAGYETRYWRAANSPVLDGDGTVRWIVHQGEDVTEIMALHANGRAQDDLLREQARIIDQLRVANQDLADKCDENLRLRSDRLNLASIVEFSDDAIVSKTLDGIVTSWNEAARRMFGYTSAEIVGNHVSVLFPPDLLPEEGAILDRLKAGRRIAHYETRRRRKDGSEIPVSLSISPIRNMAGDVIGAAKVLRDISARKQAEERLADLQAELIQMSRWNTVGIMASAITHDLNQPLTASTNYLAALRRVLAAPNPNLKLADDIVEKAMQQSRRAGQIVQRLRSFVVKGRTERADEDLADVVAEAMELAGSVLKQHGVRAALEAAAGLPPVPVDKVQIQQVLVNLVRNAAEAMSESAIRELRVRLHRSDEAGAVRIDVADSGPGLPQEIVERLFQPFATTKSAGMGLGLSICHEIVTVHGGRLWAQPNQPCGTVFSLTLPLGVEDVAD